MIKIGKVIYTLLSGSTVNGLVGGKIYPLIIPENTPMPCIVYERSFTNENTKDGFTTTSTIDITVLSENYTESIDIASAIDTVLNGFKGFVGTIRVIDSRCTNGEETFAEQSYIQKLTYTIKAI